MIFRFAKNGNREQGTGNGVEVTKMHKQLEVWKISIDFVTEIYKVTRSFPEIEKYALVQQLNRAAVSIPSNIAEGAARQGNKEFVQFLYVAMGSCAEVETQLIIAKNLGYSIKRELFEKNSQIKRMLFGLIKNKKASI
jgi:four helix bundle protein